MILIHNDNNPGKCVRCRENFSVESPKVYNKFGSEVHKVCKDQMELYENIKTEGIVSLNDYFISGK